MLLQFAPAAGVRVYDWSRKQVIRAAFTNLWFYSMSKLLDPVTLIVHYHFMITTYQSDNLVYVGILTISDRNWKPG